MIFKVEPSFIALRRCWTCTNNVNINIMLFTMLIAMHCNHGDLDSSKEVASHTPQLAQDCLLVGKVCLCTWGGGGLERLMIVWLVIG